MGQSIHSPYQTWYILIACEIEYEYFRPKKKEIEYEYACHTKVFSLFYGAAITNPENCIRLTSSCRAKKNDVILTKTLFNVLIYLFPSATASDVLINNTKFLILSNPPGIVLN